MPRVDGPFEVLECIDDNACMVDLLGDYGAFATFKVADLRSCEEDDYLYDLRSNSIKQGEDYGNQPNMSQT